LKGEGMPVHQRSGEFGDLLVKINVEFPKELSEDKILIAESLFARRSNW
jgi:DnaJ-class molecular chaperone